MGKPIIESLNNLGEPDFKHMAFKRQDWLNSGDETVFNPKHRVNSLAQKIYNNQNIVKIRTSLNRVENYKILTLYKPNEEKLPPFRAGQRINVTVNIEGCYYTNDYAISSSPLSYQKGEYNITIAKNDSDLVTKYLYNKASENEEVIVSAPFGDFYYDPIRDESNIIAIASDEGIIPIYSMMQSVRDNVDNIKLTVFYTEKKESDLILIDELIELSNSSNKIKLNFVLSEEELKGCLHGFVTADLVKKEMQENSSIFISGSEGLLKYLDKELEQLKLPKKFIRYATFLPRCNVKKVIKYNMIVYVNNEKIEIPCYNNKTIMQSIFDGGIYIPSKCHNGSCGLCRSELVKGEVKIVNDKRTQSDKKYNYIHPCTTYPASDIELIVR